MTSTSLIICTKDRAPSLAWTLRSINPTDMLGADAELVIVNNASSDETQLVAQTHARGADYPVQIVSEPTPGLGRARNTGIAAAHGSVLVFTDDDCWPDQIYVTSARNALYDTEFGWVGGMIKLADPDDAPYGLDLRDEPFDYPAGCLIDVAEVQGTCFAFARDALEAIGGFNPKLGPGNPWRADDLDACQRVLYAGYTATHDPAMVVYHAHGRRGADVDDLDAANYYARGAYHASFLPEHPAHLKCLLDLNPLSARGKAQWAGAASWVRANGTRAPHVVDESPTATPIP